MAVDDDDRARTWRGGARRVSRQDPWRRRRRLETVVFGPLLAASVALLVVSAMLVTVTARDRPERDEATQQLGVTGKLPRQQRPDPLLLAHAANPRALAAEEQDADVPQDRLDIPEPVLETYLSTADSLAADERGCGLHWSVLAAIGRIESGHARGGELDVDGNTTRAILGPRLDGGPGVAAVPDTDSGAYDGDPVWDRAVGPMQFLPETWRKITGGDEEPANPHNLSDAAKATGTFLCEQGRDLEDPQELARAVFDYNHSTEYVREVLIWANAYRRGVEPTPTELAPPMGEHDVLAGQRLPQRQPVDAPQLDLSQHPLPPPPPPEGSTDDGLGLNTEPPVLPTSDHPQGEPPSAEPAPESPSSSPPSSASPGAPESGQEQPPGTSAAETPTQQTESSTPPGKPDADTANSAPPSNAPPSGAPGTTQPSGGEPSGGDSASAANGVAESGGRWPLSEEPASGVDDGIVGTEPTGEPETP